MTESTESNSDQELWVQGLGKGQGQGRARHGRKRMSDTDGEDLSTGWMKDISLPGLMFDNDRVGPQNMLECFVLFLYNKSHDGEDGRQAMV